MATAVGSGSAIGSLVNLENELTCQICTDILYQPLTLLDCLHTFCGGCSKEWFTWQAINAAASRRRITTPPYTCPSCRESVRGTKADWRLTTLLEGYLKANPEQGKSEAEKEEMNQHYKPGDDVLPPVQFSRGVDDSDDERLMREVMDLSLDNVDPRTARQRTDRTARERHRRRPERSRRPEDSARRQQQQARSTAQEEEGRHVEHQPSLRSLLSNSEISSRDVQEEILQSIYSEGLLNGIDIDNLTPAQEEELTERIAEAYRRRQRHRDRSRHRERRERISRSPPSDRRRTDTPSRQQPSPLHQSQARPRPPISRPHLFEQHAVAGADRNHRRSASSTSHQRSRQAEDRPRNSSSGTPAAARSATDLSVNPSDGGTTQRRHRPRALSSNTRSSTDTTRVQNDVRIAHASSSRRRPYPASNSSRTAGQDARVREPSRTRPVPVENSGTSNEVVAATSVARSTTPQEEVRPVVSHAALAPEPVPTESTQADHSTPTIPAISCTRCQRPDIGSHLHYNCSKCDSGNLNLCLSCYREGRGCHHWFGFGLASMWRWQRIQDTNTSPRTLEHPHTLTPRRYILQSRPTTSTNPTAVDTQEGAFCESCFAFANDCYWSCSICLDGAWGYCNACVLRGQHCTHPLLPVAHLSTLRNSTHDPSRLAFVSLAHLKQDSYVLLPVLTDCDICAKPISPRTPRFHCYACSDGDYDICPACYHSLVATGKITAAHGPNGWRRCLQGHRMAVLGYRDPSAPDPPDSSAPAPVTEQLPHPQGVLEHEQHLQHRPRITLREIVGGHRLRDDAPYPTAPDPGPRRGAGIPPDGGEGARCLASWSRWPREGDRDELAFPKNAEIREVEDRNADWSVGVFAGRVGLFPRNHTRRI